MLNFTSITIGKSKIANLAIPVCEDTQIHDAPEINALIDEAKKIDSFSGEKNQQVIRHGLMEGKVVRCVFVGIGSLKKITAESLRVFAGCAVKNAMGAKCKDIVIVPPMGKNAPVAEPACLTAILEGAFLANHTFTRYKEKPKNNLLTKISLLVPSQKAKQHQSLPTRIEAICQGTLKARDWVNTPSNDKLPEQLARSFEKSAREAGLKVRTLNETQLRQQKFNALLAVAAGSEHAPRLVEMSFAPPKAKKTLVLVGKGVTFDTGGISLKSAAGMDAMKADMAGAATVAGTMTAVARLNPACRIIGITPIVENMPSGKATRPGDIVTSYQGKTVEIGNTDAEGRLILIDAMAYAIKKYKPDVVIDLATLTGACVVALGEKIAGVFSEDEELSQAIVDAGQTTFERCWPMPMPAEYKELLKSDFADISNMSSSRYGGAITAALFLSEFVGDTRWAHIDIAGPAFVKKASDYCTPGASGFGVRLLCELIEKMEL